MSTSLQLQAYSIWRKKFDVKEDLTGNDLKCLARFMDIFNRN